MSQREKAKLETVTEEMREAGANLLLAYEPDFDNEDDLASAIYLAMLHLSPAFPAHVGKSKEF